MKAGTFKAELKKEDVLWYDRKRVLFFGLPWSLTKYVVTDSRLKITKGFLRTVQEDIQLYRIADVTYVRSLAERLCGVGTLIVVSSDASLPRATIKHVKQAGKVRDLILQTVEEARKRSGVNTSELVGMGVRPGMGVPPVPPNAPAPNPPADHKR